MELKFADNSTEDIGLTAVSNIPGENTPCLFSGELLRDPKSKIAASGCHSSGVTSLSIKSDFVKDGIIDLTILNSMTYEFIFDEDLATNELENDAVKTSRRIKRQILRNKGNDAIIPPPNPNKIRKRFRGPLPPMVTLKTTIVYDNSLKKYFGNSDKATKQWLSRVVELTKPRMAHSSLDLPIDIAVEKVEHLDKTIKADGDNIRSLKPTSFTSYFCEDLGFGIVGIAYLNAACRTDGFNHNINELFTEKNSELATARVYAHELGHNVGMQ